MKLVRLLRSKLAFTKFALVCILTLLHLPRQLLSLVTFLMIQLVQRQLILAQERLRASIALVIWAAM